MPLAIATRPQPLCDHTLVEISLAGVVTRPHTPESGHAHSAHLAVLSTADFDTISSSSPLASARHPDQDFEITGRGNEDYLRACRSQILALRRITL